MDAGLSQKPNISYFVQRCSDNPENDVSFIVDDLAIYYTNSIEVKRGIVYCHSLDICVPICMLISSILSEINHLVPNR